MKVGGKIVAALIRVNSDSDHGQVRRVVLRPHLYKHAGYFDPDEADEIKARAARSDVTWPPAILRGFVQRYGQRVPARAQAG